MSKALTSRPFASRTLRRPVMSWLTSLMARIGFSSVRSRITVPASTIRSTRSVAPTLSSMVVSLMFESPTITCSRRNRSASGLQHLARTADDLPGDQERDQDVGQPAELPVPADQIVLVAAVGVARGVGVVLEQ